MAGASAVQEKTLYVAASRGDLVTLKHLLGEDNYLLQAVSFACSRNLVHVATMHRQAAIVKELVRMDSQLARDVDSNKSSPLHIAAARGIHDIAEMLATAAPEVCWWRDGQGMNPFHVAAMNDHVGIMEHLNSVDPFPAKEKLDRGQNVLHLCLKHRKLAALKYLVKNLNELVNVEDDDGEMLLHTAIRSKQVEVVRYLVEKHETYELPTNSKGKTMHQISQEGPRDEDSIEIDKILSCRISYSGQPVGFLGRMSDVNMVVVVLIAAMSFQAIVSPAGGVWPDNSSPPHKAGHAVMASTRPIVFKSFILANATAFTSSIFTIILLSIGLPSGSIAFTIASMCMTWVSVACIAISYVASAIAISPNFETQSLTHVVLVVAAMFLFTYIAFCFSRQAAFASRLTAYKMASRWRRLQLAAAGGSIPRCGL